MECFIYIQYKNEMSNGQMEDSLLTQECLEAKTDCAIRHSLEVCVNQRQVLLLDKVTHMTGSSGQRWTDSSPRVM